MPKSDVRIFVVLGIIILSVCSGCVHILNNDDDSSLGGIEIRNNDSTTHTVDIIIEKNEKFVYWRTHSVIGRGDNTIGSKVITSEKFANKSGDYTIIARIDNKSTGTIFNLSGNTKRGCYIVQIRIEENEDITYLTSENSYECG